ncbi:inner nuclear membrane protein Man1-like [Limulus polyphemus]|uniref:Inner nuclear membrane protein Man1-like n=1 Tax=Limulus polyphemus TaxID=6850 RepID=A0ABM1B4N7_LIMPO|nr:inner nuclear membrane protein Man1-like [Limulus polyphemus]
MASKISDTELRHKLKELGEDVGPITDSTRYLWQKKLNNLLNDQKKNLRKRSISKSVNSKKLGGFSSDESELDSTANKTVRSGRKRVSTKNMSDNYVSNLKNSPKKLPLSLNKHMDENDFKIPGPVPLNSKKSLSRKKHLSRSCASDLTRHGLKNLNGSVGSDSVLDTSYDVDSSDSDVDFDRQKLTPNQSRQDSSLYATSFSSEVNKHTSMKKNISTKNGNYDLVSSEEVGLWKTVKHGIFVSFYRLYTRNGESCNILNSLDVYTLESTKASKPFLCRLRQATKKAFWQVAVIVLVIVLACGCMQYVKFSKRRRESEWKELISMIERIIEILKHQYEASQSDPSIKGYVAISHVRDMLIPLSERKSKENLWKRVVKFLEENESRVRVEDQHIAGEVFNVWRWIQISPPENSNKKDKVWQGQAFGNGDRSPNMLPFAPTPCLKIRNMFDPEVEYGDDWHVRIQDAILEKCESNSGIVHMYVDKSSKEGCVFLKCNTLQAAREAYSSLHGWWFDGKLVTVKYLRLERYHERFPASRYSTMPLKPSNNMRLSLSVPFQNSVLERT